MNEFRVEWSERQSLMLSGTWRDTEYRLDVSLMMLILRSAERIGNFVRSSI